MLAVAGRLLTPSFWPVTFQFFDTIGSAYNYAEEQLENATILIHSGVYQREFLVIDSNVTMIGAGQSSRSLFSPVGRAHRVVCSAPSTSGLSLSQPADIFSISQSMLFRYILKPHR